LKNPVGAPTMDNPTGIQAFFAAFSARFSFKVFSGFFFTSFFRFSIPFAMSRAP